MMDRTAASEFLYRRPQTTDSDMDWLNDHKKKAEILTLRQFLYRVLETSALG